VCSPSGQRAARGNDDQVSGYDTPARLTRRLQLDRTWSDAVLGLDQAEAAMAKAIAALGKVERRYFSEAIGSDPEPEWYVEAQAQQAIACDVLEAMYRRIGSFI